MIKANIKSIITSLKNKIIKKIAGNIHLLFDITLKFLYLLILVIVLINIINFSYKAWLYPIRINQYFDECSYISMGKYFRTISPVKIFTDYIIKNKKIPQLYNEFNCRLLYWPILLSFPLKYTEDRIELHKFRAVLMTIGTILFFLIGFKLGGITGGVVSSAFWIGIPILNYWGHFFMSENPSFIFLTAGYICLLYSDRTSISSFFGGIFLAIAGLMRFTTISLIFAAPFIIIAVYFNPFKRKNFQILGELSKTFAGFAFTYLPYLFFTWWLYKNPFFPFISARSALNKSFINDSLYYARNLWNECGILLQIGVILSFISPLIISFAWVIKKILRNNGKNRINFNLIESEKLTFTNFFKIIKKKLYTINYLNIYIRGILYYGIIILSFVITSSIYIYGISDIPHKLPRYLMGAIIPLIFISSIGFGFIEILIINLFRFTGSTILNNFKYKNKNYFLQKIILISSWFIGFVACIIIISNISINVWNTTMDKPFNIKYEIPDDTISELRKNNNTIAIQRLQPENLAWKKSINDRLKDIPDNGIDETDYFGNFFWTIIKYLNENLKKDEVFYVDIYNYIPYTPAYTEVPCILLDSYYNNSINTLIKKEELLYKGYVLVYNDKDEDTFNEKEKVYRRSLNRDNIISSKKFKFIKKFGPLSLYYYPSGEPFPYKFGTKERIKRLYNINEKRDKINNINKNEIFDKILSPWKLLFKKRDIN